MTAEEKYELACIATEEYRTNVYTPPNLNQYPLGIDDILKERSRPGFIFRESSLLYPDGMVVHEISGCAFCYTFEPLDDGKCKFVIKHEGSHAWNIPFRHGWIEEEGGDSRALVNRFIDDIEKSATDLGCTYGEVAA